VKRREFITLLGGAAAAWPLAARAQHPAMPVIGLLGSASAMPYKPFVDAIFQGLGEEGFVQGKNVAVEQRWADGQYDRLPAFASELVRLRVNVIVAIAPPAARAAKAATSSIPVVFSTAGDPVALGLVSSLNRPGGNLTGVNFLLFATVTKRIELLTKLAPTADTIGVLVNPSNPSTARSVTEAQAAAEALAHFVQQKVRAIMIEGDPFLTARRDQIVALVAQHSLPAVYSHREYAEVGGLVSYGTSLTDAYRQVGVYTGRVLKGEQPANLPVMQATKFELVINLKTAKALGLQISDNLLSLADEVIK
jgi:putative tryptophan/tyrosine transport system substrate-binding protein